MNKTIRDICDALDDAERLFDACEERRYTMTTVRYGKGKKYKRSFPKLCKPTPTIDEPKKG